MALLFTSYTEPACFGPSAEERLLAQLLRGTAGKEPEPFRPLGSGSHPVDLLASKEAYELRADAPGLSADDIAVEVHEGILIITASTSKPAATEPATTAATKKAPTNGSPFSPPAPQQQQQPAGPQWQLLRRERANGTQRWSRAFVLPDTADVDGISVSLERGVLAVRVPVRPPPPKPQPRRFAVSGSSSSSSSKPLSPAQQEQSQAAADVQHPSSPVASEARQQAHSSPAAAAAATGDHQEGGAQ